MTAPTTYLELGWGTSRGRDTYGYNIRRLRDTDTGKRFRCMGGGYDMTGTVLAEWFTDRYADRIMAAVDSGELIPWSTLTDPVGESPDTAPLTRTYADPAAQEGHGGSSGAYGLTVLAYGRHADHPVPSIDGACGESSVVRIMRAVGLDVRVVRNTRAGEAGFIVTDTREDGAR